MANKKNVNIWKSLQKVPAGTMFVPLIIGAVITSLMRCARCSTRCSATRASWGFRS